MREKLDRRENEITLLGSGTDTTAKPRASGSDAPNEPTWDSRTPWHRDENGNNLQNARDIEYDRDQPSGRKKPNRISPAVWAATRQN